MDRKVRSTALASIFISLGALSLAPAAGAATTIPLTLSQSAAFAILGHSCGGIQEQVYATGFGTNGYPAGEAFLSTTCSSGGRGSRPTTYTGAASMVWDWFGETRSFAALGTPAEGTGPSFS